MSFCDDLIGATDDAATMLKTAGAESPKYMNGAAFLGGIKTRQYIFAPRDRIDEAVDCIRYVRSKRHKYMRPRASDYVYSGTCSLASTANLTALTLR